MLEAESLSKLRILLWDIDGTILLSKVSGSYKRYFASTMEKVFGSAGELDSVMPSGMTDTQIMYEALKSRNLTPEDILSKRSLLLRVFREEMLKVLECKAEGFFVLNGVREALEKTSLYKDVFVNALLTGNLSVAAEIKLRSVGLWDYFADSPNAFGEISCDRKVLASYVAGLFQNKYDFNFSPQQFIIIGDTPNDIVTARSFGAKVISVATGKYSYEDLLRYKPDAVFDDLSDTEKFLETLQNV
ncbi:MAG: HAD hydrolase-like protein [Pyrinomonadaceae bacterium]|nr:HAD hydrolase-like protein [Pyrinomonadaceae bacterium]MCX7640219.1 HAD hydrolase-like protein [Pyrinomonadaceae bacterium]MDW8303936.1 HAD hydrolase-like protein [Acidobacteriota bacterium]